MQGPGSCPGPGDKQEAREARLPGLCASTSPDAWPNEKLTGSRRSHQLRVGLARRGCEGGRGSMRCGTPRALGLPRTVTPAPTRHIRRAGRSHLTSGGHSQPSVSPAAQVLSGGDSRTPPAAEPFRQRPLGLPGPQRLPVSSLPMVGVASRRRRTRRL
jgi:hypothetical protein